MSLTKELQDEFRKLRDKIDVKIYSVVYFEKEQNDVFVDILKTMNNLDSRIFLLEEKKGNE